MREIFEDLGQLFGFYQYLKYKVISMPSILPKQDFGDNTQKFRAKSQQMSVEDHFAFIGDIELFPTNHYYYLQRGYKPAPPDCLLLVFHLKFCPALSRFESYGHLASHFARRIRKRREPLPKRLMDRSNLQRIANDMSGKAELYFTEKGYIAVPIYNEKIP